MLTAIRRTVGKLVGSTARRRWHVARSPNLLVSFPKCGRTWLRGLLGHYLARMHDLDVSDLDLIELFVLNRRNRRVPRIWVDHLGDPQYAHFRTISVDPAAYARKRVIFLVRDPRDVVVSSYFQKSRRRQLKLGSIGEYLKDDVGSLRSIIAYDNAWLAAAPGLVGFHLVRYEDLHRDGPGTLAALVAWLMPERKPEPALVAAALDAMSFDKMRKMEESNRGGFGVLGARDPADPSSFKTREGKVGGHRKHFTAEELAWMEEVVRCDLNPTLGYNQPPQGAA